MKRYLSIISIVFLLMMTIFPSSAPIAFAASDGEGKTQFENGTHDISIKVLKDSEDVESTMQGFVESAQLVVDEESLAVAISFKNADMIKSLKTEYQGALTEAKFEDGVATFPIENVNDIVNGEVFVEVPGLYSTTHGIRIVVDASNVPTVETEPEEEMEEPVEKPDESEQPQQPEETENPDEAENPGNTDDADTPENPNDSETPVQSDLENGEYTLPVTVLHGTKDEQSSMKSYVGENAKLVVDGEKLRVTITLDDARDMITNIQTEYNGELVDSAINKDEKTGVKTASFNVESIDTILNGNVTVDTKSPYGVMKHDVRFDFGEAIKGESPEPEGLADGDYLIETSILYESEDKESTAAKYIQNPAKLTVKDGKNTIFFTITDHESIKGLKIGKGNDLKPAKVVSVDEKTNSRVVSFDVEQFDEVLNGQFHVYIPSIDYDAKPIVRIIFDEDSIKEDDGSLPSLPEVTEDHEDGEYTINYRVLHATEFEKSKMGEYLVAPADLSIKDGKNIVTMTIKDHKTIKDFKVEQNGELSDAKIVNVDEKANTRDVQFEIDDLDGEYKANISVFVPEANYTGNYKVRLFFEENSIKVNENAEEPEDETNEPEEVTELQGEPIEYKVNVDMMNSFIEGVNVTETGDVHIRFNTAAAIADFKVDLGKGLQSAEKVEVGGDFVDYVFKPASTNADIEAQVSVKAGTYESDYDFILTLINPNEETEEPEDETNEPEEVTELQGEPIEYKVNVDMMKSFIEGVNVTKTGDVHIRFNSAAAIADFKVDLGKGLQSAEKVEVGGDFVDYVFKPVSTNADIEAQVSVKAGTYESDYDFILTLINPDEEDDEPADYSINYVIKHETEDKASSADPFFEKPGIIVEKDGKFYLQVKVNNWNMIDNLKADGKDVIVVEENASDNTAIIQIPVQSDLSKIIPLTMKVTVPGLYEMNHVARLVMDVDSYQEPDDEEIDETDKNQETEPKPKPEEVTVADKTYNIDYIVLHETENKPSVADSFFNKPGKILEKDGIYYLQVTVDSKNWSMIERLSIEGKEIKVLEEKGKFIVQVKLGSDIPKSLLLDMFINVPGLYKENHKARLVLDLDTLVEVEENGKIIGEEGTPPKPGFGSNDNEEDGATSTDGNTNNPKTGDTANVLAYTLLFLLSVSVLVVQYRRKLV